MRYDELDPATRREVDRAIGRRSSGSRTPERQRPRPAGTAPKTGAERWRCECGQEFTVWARVEDHRSGSGHSRLSIVLTGNPVTPDP